MLSRLTLLQISLIGLFVLLFVTGIMFFAVIRPKQQQLSDVRAAAAASKSDHGTDTDVAREQATLKKAQADKVTTIAEWQEAAATYMPSFPFTNDVLTTYPKISRIPGEYSAFVTNWYDAQRKFGIARLAGTAFQIPAFPPDPNFVSDLKFLTLPSAAAPWQVQVEAKTFDDAIDHLRRFNNEILHHGMPVVDGVMLSGESPHLLVSYSLALYIILGNTPPKADARIGNGPAGGGAGGTLGAAGFGKGGGMGGAGGFGRPTGGGGGFGRPMGGAGGRRANK